MAAIPAGPAAPPPAGSMRWYAWLFTPESSRPVTAAMFALEAELRSTVAARVDHGVSHLKLQWWKDEVHRLEIGQPRHPLTAALSQARPCAANAWQPLQDALAGLELELASASYETEAELDVYYTHAAGFCRALARALTQDDPTRLERLGGALGRSVRTVEVIRDLRPDAQDGRVFLPLHWLAEQRISHVELRAEHGGEGARRCLERLAERSRRDWQGALAELGRPAMPELRGLRVLGALHAALLDRMERDSFVVGHHRFAMAPIESLWTAWRAARQH